MPGKPTITVQHQMLKIVLVARSSPDQIVCTALWLCHLYGVLRCNSKICRLAICDECKHNLNFQEQSDWKACMHGGRNKLRTYKHSFEWEPYLTHVKSPLLRTALCRFCISCHLLEIERGRFHEWNPNLQISVNCQSCLQLGRKLVEDEVHFLMSCSTYEEERLKLFDAAAAHISSFQENET